MSIEMEAALTWYTNSAHCTKPVAPIGWPEREKRENYTLHLLLE